MSEIEKYLREKPELGFDFKMVTEFLATRCKIHGSLLLGAMVFCKRQYAFMVNQDYQFFVEKCNGNDNSYLISWTKASEEIFHPISIIQYQNSFEFATRLWGCVSKVI